MVFKVFKVFSVQEKNIRKKTVAHLAEVHAILDVLAIPVLWRQRVPRDLQVADLAAAPAHIHGRRARNVLVRVARVRRMRRPTIPVDL